MGKRANQVFLSLSGFGEERKMALKKKSPLGFGVFRLYTEREKDQHIGAMFAQWEKEKRQKSMVGKPFLTVSRQYGCMALETGLRFTECLNRLKASEAKWTLYDKEIVSRIACDMKMSKRLADLLTSGTRTKIARYMDAHLAKWPVEDEVFQGMVRVIRTICEKGHAVVVGRGACKIAQDLPNGFHIRIVAPLPWRTQQVASFYQLSEEDAIRTIRLFDAEREAFFRKYFDEDIGNPNLYDMVLNQGTLSMDLIVDLVAKAMQAKGIFES
jgi:cytidylate kinase